ncbi:MAG TPA: hypothetical protein VJN18_32630 [Polyangiaceae bacterium]|nr:hypothetical protein [Polyangiaceae bacterium]
MSDPHHLDVDRLAWWQRRIRPAIPVLSSKIEIDTREFSTLLAMASELLELKGLGLEPDKVVFAGPDHPVWTSIDDDDWNGATYEQWLQRLEGKVVYLLPPEGAPLERVLTAVRQNGAEAHVLDERGPLDLPYPASTGNLVAALPEFTTDAERALLDRCASLQAERDEARDWVRKLTSKERTLTCVYCGHAYPPGTPDHGADVLKAHVEVCEKHPMAALRSRAEAAERALESASKHHDEHHERDNTRWAKAQEVLGLQAAWPALFDRAAVLVAAEAELEELKGALEFLSSQDHEMFVVPAAAILETARDLGWSPT